MSLREHPDWSRRLPRPLVIPKVRSRLVELSASAGLAAAFIVKSGALDSPFVLVDVGVRGGIHPRWLPLKPAGEIYGFDAIAEGPSPNSRHYYFKLALGDYDGECSIPHVMPTSPTNCWFRSAATISARAMPRAASQKSGWRCDRPASTNIAPAPYLAFRR